MRLSFRKAAELIRERLNCSVGRSHAELRRALASGEIRHEAAHDYTTIDGEVSLVNLAPLTTDDGLMSADLRFGGYRSIPPPPRPPSGYPNHISEVDLLDWLDRHHPPVQLRRHRYPGDSALVKKGKKMVAGGLAKLAVARQLAPRAKSGTIEQRVERLRKLL